MDGGRDVVPDRAVGADLVVVPTPSIQLFPAVGKAHEPVRVQALGPELRIERLDEAVIRRFPGAREVQRDVVRISPQVEIAGDEFAAIIHADCTRVAARPAHPF